MNAALDSFETALLARLREHVEHEPAMRPRRPRRRFMVAAAGVAAAAAAFVVVPGLGANPAYSVGEGNAGTITVEVHRLEDAKGLEAELAKYGVRADITYLPRMQQCAPGRYTEVARRLSGMGISIGSDRLRVTLPPGTVRDGETFVMSVSGQPIPPSTSGPDEDGVTDLGGFSSSSSFSVTAGPVQPCRAVPGPENQRR